MSTAKKSLTLIFILILISCDNSNSTDNSTFNPPNWLLGTWNNELETAFLKTYIISNDNVVLINQEDQETNYSELIENDPNRTLVEIENSNSIYKYKIIVDMPNGFPSDYIVTFNKISELELMLEVRITNVSYSQMTYFKG